MLSIIGVYKLPVLRHIFLIVDSLHDFLDNLMQSEANKIRKGYFERILRSKDHRVPKADLQWTIRVVCVHDFLEAIKLSIPIGTVSTNQTCQNPEELELLAINLVKTHPPSRDKPFDTPKVLSRVHDEDIIEVFI